MDAEGSEEVKTSGRQAGPRGLFWEVFDQRIQISLLGLWRQSRWALGNICVRLEIGFLIHFYEFWFLEPRFTRYMENRGEIRHTVLTWVTTIQTPTAS